MAGRPDPTRMLSAALFGEDPQAGGQVRPISEAQQLIRDLAAGRHGVASREASLAAGLWSTSVRTNSLWN
jgi:hypothetical protein